jgi:hypothetical protein
MYIVHKFNLSMHGVDSCMYIELLTGISVSLYVDTVHSCMYTYCIDLLDCINLNNSTTVRFLVWERRSFSLRWTVNPNTSVVPISSCAMWQLPVKTIHEVRQHDLNSSQPKVEPRAHPSPSTERNELKLFPFKSMAAALPPSMNLSGMNSSAFSP